MATPITNLINNFRSKRLVCQVKELRYYVRCLNITLGQASLHQYQGFEHINIKYSHHFTEHVEQGRVSIHSIKFEDQLAEILNKPLAKQDYGSFRDIILVDSEAPSSTSLQGSLIDRKKGTPECAATIRDWVILALCRVMKRLCGDRLQSMSVKIANKFHNSYNNKQIKYHFAMNHYSTTTKIQLPQFYLVYNILILIKVWTAIGFQIFNRDTQSQSCTCTGVEENLYSNYVFYSWSIYMELCGDSFIHEDH